MSDTGLADITEKMTSQPAHAAGRASAKPVVNSQHKDTHANQSPRPMTPAEKMSHRVAFVNRLIDTDQSLTHLLSQEPSNRVLAECRSLLSVRRSIVDELRLAGYHAWPIPIDECEAKVS